MVVHVYLQLAVIVLPNVAPLEQVFEEIMKLMISPQLVLEVSEVTLQRVRPSVDVCSYLGECPA